MHDTGIFRCLLAGWFSVLLGAASASAQTAPQPPAPPEEATEAQGFIPEPMIVQRAVIFGDRHLAGGGRSNGFFVEAGDMMITGAGWISLGPGYRRWFADDKAVADASAAISWRGYKTAQARFELPRLMKSRIAVGSQLRWLDFGQVSYFGEGPDTSELLASDYRIKATNVAAHAAYRPIETVAIGTEIGWLQPSISPRSGFFKRQRPDTQDLFGHDIVYAVGDQPAFIHTGLSVTADTRDFPGHPTRGGLYRAATTNFSDRDAGLFTFRRYEAEAAQFVPLADSRLVIAVRGWLVASDVGAGRFVPFYLQPSLGGHNTLRGYADYRFHDRHMMVLNAEARVPMMTHVDAAVFMDAGNVASRIGDLDFDKRSYGFGFRLHSRRETFARLDLARGSEGWRLFFKLSDPLSLGRVSRRPAPAPFAP